MKTTLQLRKTKIVEGIDIVYGKYDKTQSFNNIFILI